MRQRSRIIAFTRKILIKFLEALFNHGMNYITSYLYLTNQSENKHNRSARKQTRKFSYEPIGIAKTKKKKKARRNSRSKQYRKEETEKILTKEITDN